MVHCVAYGCTNDRKKKEYIKKERITFHRFPKNPEIRNLWIKAVRRGNWTPSRTSVLCSIHFREEFFDRTSLCYVRLRENAIPDIFPHHPKHFQKPIEERRPLKQKSDPSILENDFTTKSPTKKKLREFELTTGIPSKRSYLKNTSDPTLCLPTPEARISSPDVEETNSKSVKNEHVKADNSSYCKFSELQNYEFDLSHCNDLSSNCSQKYETNNSSPFETSQPTTIRICNLPEETLHSDLHKLFGSFGNINKICLIKRVNESSHKVLAFINFTNHEDASRALVVDRFTFGQSVLKVDWARSS